MLINISSTIRKGIILFFGPENDIVAIIAIVYSISYIGIQWFRTMRRYIITTMMKASTRLQLNAQSLFSICFWSRSKDNACNLYFIFPFEWTIIYFVANNEAAYKYMTL